MINIAPDYRAELCVRIVCIVYACLYHIMHTPTESVPQMNAK